MSGPDFLTRQLLRQGTRQAPPLALMYHGVARPGGVPPWPWAVSLSRFREQLDWLAAQGYATRTLDEAGGELPGNTVFITFDDGYADNLTAVDELARRGMRATWFVVTGSIGRDPQWLDPGRPPGRLLDAAELRAMAAAGMEIGSHTVSHMRLTGADDELLRAELADSRRTLEDTLGREVPSFAYPYGEWNERCEAMVREAGYRFACTTRTGWALRDGHPLRVRRLTVFNNDDAGVFARKLVFASHDVGWHDVGRYAWQRLAQKLKDNLS